MIEIEQIGTWLPLIVENKEKGWTEKLTAIINTGFKADIPIIALANVLCIKLKIKKLDNLRTPTGEPIKWLHWTSERAHVCLVLDENTSNCVDNVRIVFADRPYNIINTFLASKLGIGTYDPHEGSWFIREKECKCLKIYPSARPHTYY